MARIHISSFCNWGGKELLSWRGQATEHTVTSRAGQAQGDVMVRISIINSWPPPPRRGMGRYLELHIRRVLQGSKVSSHLCDKHILGKGSLLPREGPVAGCLHSVCSACSTLRLSYRGTELGSSWQQLCAVSVPVLLWGGGGLAQDTRPSGSPALWLPRGSQGREEQGAQAPVLPHTSRWPWA